MSGEYASSPSLLTGKHRAGDSSNSPDLQFAFQGENEYRDGSVSPENSPRQLSRKNNDNPGSATQSPKSSPKNATPRQVKVENLSDHIRAQNEMAANANQAVNNGSSVEVQGTGIFDLSSGGGENSNSINNQINTDLTNEQNISQNNNNISTVSGPPNQQQQVLNNATLGPTTIAQVSTQPLTNAPNLPHNTRSHNCGGHIYVKIDLAEVMPVSMSVLTPVFFDRVKSDVIGFW